MKSGEGYSLYYKWPYFKIFSPDIEYVYELHWFEDNVKILYIPTLSGKILGGTIMKVCHMF